MASEYEDPSTWRLRTTGSLIPYRILSREGTFGEEDATATEAYLIPAHRLNDFALEFLPAPYYLGAFPIYPARGTLHGTPLQATQINWKAHIDGKPVDPFNLDSTAPDGTYQPNCVVTVEYGTSKFEGSETDPQDPFTFLEVSTSAAGEFIHTTAPAAKWKADADVSTVDAETNKLLTVPVTLTIPTTDWSVNWPRVPHEYYKNELIVKLRAALGKVNSLTMDLFFGATKETVLFVGYSLRQSFTWRTATQAPFTLSMKFEEKHVVDKDGKTRGHNDFWKPDEGWQYLLLNGEDPTYQSTDLNQIFKP